MVVIDSSKCTSSKEEVEMLRIIKIKEPVVVVAGVAAVMVVVEVEKVRV
jgi:signal recognition particle receptor subunit beta